MEVGTGFGVTMIIIIIIPTIATHTITHMAVELISIIITATTIAALITTGHMVALEAGHLTIIKQALTNAVDTPMGQMVQLSIAGHTIPTKAFMPADTRLEIHMNHGEKVLLQMATAG